MPIPTLLFVLFGALAGCATETPECIDPYGCGGQPIPGEAQIFEELLSGEAQRQQLCQRLASQGFESPVRDVFCGASVPPIAGIADIYPLLGLSFDGPVGLGSQYPDGYNGNPNWAVNGHSSSLARRITSTINPRVIVHTPSGEPDDSEPGFLITAYVRGERFVEIIAHDADKNDLRFFLLRYTLPCDATDSCTPTDEFSLATESGWTSWTLYDDKDLENTVFDCMQCHESGLRTATEPTSRRLLMFELNSTWRHWIFTNKHFIGWEDTPEGPGPYLDMLDDYLGAHATDAQPEGETYAGIEGGNVMAGRPLSLENLIEGNGYGNGFFDSGKRDNGHNFGMFSGTPWPELYAMNQLGLIIQIPSPFEDPTDSTKRRAHSKAFRAFLSGEASELPDITDIFPDDRMHEVGLQVTPGLTAPEILVQACTQCHHDGLNQELTRARFTVDLARLDAEALTLAQQRINLPEGHYRTMPPTRLRTLLFEERERATTYLQRLIEGLAIADNGQPPSGVTGFVETPRALSHRAVIMRATDGDDPRGLVEYRFTEVTGNPGGSASEWQLSPVYMDSGLEQGVEYRYTVRARDRDGNESPDIAALSVTIPTDFELIGDGAGDYDEFCDTTVDADCDELPDSYERAGDTDNDGILDVNDIDDDGDSLATSTEIADSLVIGSDPDNDGIPAWWDDDSDGDGIPDAEESGGDIDLDGIPNYLDKNDDEPDQFTPLYGDDPFLPPLSHGDPEAEPDPPAPEPEPADSGGCRSAARPTADWAVVWLALGLLAVIRRHCYSSVND
ncbi:MAG: hypothetical protein ACI9WU_004754 [Myxococcota bacterium]